jgi:hypothetical protein
MARSPRAEQALDNLQSQVTILKIISGLLIGGDCLANNLPRVDDHEIIEILGNAEALVLLLDESELASTMQIIKSAASFRPARNAGGS